MRLRKQIPITTASAAPDSGGEVHVRVFVPPYSPLNNARASSAIGAIVPSLPGFEGPYWRRRASDSVRCAWRATDRRCLDAFWLRTAAQCSGHRVCSHFSASPFEGTASAHSPLSASSSMEAFLRSSWSPIHDRLSALIEICVLHNHLLADIFTVTVESFHLCRENPQQLRRAIDIDFH
jgi:hypothetical protein